MCGQVCVNTIAISTYTGPSQRRWKPRGGETRWTRKIRRMRESLKGEINRNGMMDTKKQKGDEGKQSLALEGQGKELSVRCFRDIKKSGRG